MFSLNNRIVKKCDHSARWLEFTIFKTAALLGISPQMSLEFTQRRLSKKQPKKTHRVSSSAADGDAKTVGLDGDKKKVTVT